MKLRLSALLLLLCTAIPAFARVLSYSPYTNKTARPGYHERTSRQFVLIESAPNASRFDDQQLVLYDTVDQEPRDVTPAGGVKLLAAALHEADGGATFLLAVVVDNAGLTVRTLFSSDSGSTWKNVAALHDKYVELASWERDRGGPWVQGLTPDIRVGSDAWPFVLTLDNRGGVWAISRTGEAKQINAHPDHVTVAGQNAAGTKFLIGEYMISSSASTRVRFRIVSPEGGAAPPFESDFVLPEDEYSGWIADNDTVYIVATRREGRFLYVYRNGRVEGLAGPRGAVIPPYNQETDHPTRQHDLFIAVPTHDFNGAWMVQRGTSEPTTLMRHTAIGLETAWSDPSGPEVEALIAGPSGESVLIQVHRERSLAGEEDPLLFIDPALAVWRIGEPMPRGYDELYLNEGIDKGFVHVNPDEMRAGGRFVFNSGLLIPGGGGPPPLRLPPVEAPT
jgi:hypothetical protein